MLKITEPIEKYRDPGYHGRYFNIGQHTWYYNDETKKLMHSRNCLCRNNMVPYENIDENIDEHNGNRSILGQYEPYYNDIVRLCSVWYNSEGYQNLSIYEFLTASLDNM